MLLNLFTSLSQNTTAANQLFGIQMMTDRHRYFLQRYFDNERTFQTTTVGGMSLTLTGSLAANATSATLTATWAYPTVQQLTNFSNSDQRTALFTNGSAAITWVGGLSSTATTAISTVGVQKYAIPAVISKIKNSTINVGQLKYVPAPVMTRTEWDLLNFLPYTSQIVNYFFLYAGNVEFFPIPSSTGNIITFNHKSRVPDFSTSFLFSDTSGTAFVAGSPAFDYQAGSLSGITLGSTSITGSGTSWNTTGKFPLNTDVSFNNLYLVINPPSGDGLWYPISQFNSDTSLTLSLPILSAPSTTTAAHGYAIAQMPVLSEDFHDILPYDSLKTYFASVKKDAQMFKLYQSLVQERQDMMEEYLSDKTVNIDLGASPQLINANLYPFANN